VFCAADRKDNARDKAMNRYVTVGLVVVAGAALFEAALVPAVVIGGAAVLAPKLLPTRRLRQVLNGATRRRRAAAKAATAIATTSTDQPTANAPWTILPKFAFGQAIAKTITYRVIVTGLDFTVNFVVIGELGTAAGLSTFNMIAGPLSYLGHEAVWNYLGPAEDTIALGTLAGRRTDGDIAQGGWQNFKISRTLAKTVTFRTLATLMDFTVNYVVVRDVTQAVILSSSGFILGPFVYYGHEWVWDRFTKPQQPTADMPAPIKLLPAPTPA
jgi:uncharacterized membrane protein